MKCPVCEKTINDNSIVCYYCGFDKMRGEFINEDDRNAWYNDTVIPCKKVYEKMKSYTDSTDNIVNTVEKTPKQPNTKLDDGWNYDDALAHPNGARCKHTLYETRMELTDISTQIDVLGNATISFVAKRVKDSSEKKQYPNLADDKTVGFCWRLKDERGIIILTGEWENDNLLIGDAIADKIELINVPNGYSIDFVDCT